jgi:hypothetical protein
MAAVMSIKRTYEKHRRENPESILSERAIRQAVKNRSLPSINAGAKALICTDTFDKWIKGEL